MEQSNPPATQSTPSSEVDLDAKIAEGVAKALAARDEAAAKAKEDDEKAKVAQKPKSTWPFGNQDKKKEYDLSKITGLNDLPDDKVVVIHPAWNKDGAGERTTVDLKNSTVQYYDIDDYANRTKTDKNTGSSTFQMLAMEPILVHDPSK